jgi:NAD(P)-dependent dehydrogenase (short-subunit alcohol dehydrogenase family)
MSEESYDRVMNVNAKGTLFLTQAVARHMLTLPMEGRRKRATIVNISSCSAEIVSLNRGEYCISKAGVSMVTRLFARRLAPEGILVHEVRPGVIATDMTSSVQEKYDRLIADGAFPLARWGTPQDVADAVSLFCSDRLAYTTGNYLDVDGGYHIPAL